MTTPPWSRTVRPPLSMRAPHSSRWVESGSLEAGERLANPLDLGLNLIGGERQHRRRIQGQRTAGLGIVDVPQDDVGMQVGHHVPESLEVELGRSIDDLEGPREAYGLDPVPRHLLFAQLTEVGHMSVLPDRDAVADARRPVV